MSDYNKGVQECADSLGLTVEDMLEEAVCDSIVSGYCADCDTVLDSCEPDMENGWCESCGNRNVKSILVLCELI